MDIKQRSNGRWRDILTALGVEARFLTNHHGPCPICAEGHNRFRFDDKNGEGTWFCSHCGAGDGFKMLMVLKGVDFPGAVRLAEEVVGSCRQERVRQRAPRDMRTLSRLWEQSTPLSPDNHAGRYLLSRIGTPDPETRDLANISALEHRDEDGKVTGNLPALLALVRDETGSVVNIHRTYLGLNGGKAKVSPVRKLMAGPLPPGGAIRLFPRAKRLAVAEGIETALCAAKLFRLPCWALISATQMERWIPPSYVEHLTICADHDLTFVGQAAAFALAKRLAGKIEVEVLTPIGAGEDFADVWGSRLESAA